MIKELLINGAVNRYALSNRARQAIAFQYITDTRTLRLIDTYNNVALDLVAEGDNSLTSSAMEKVWQYIQNKVDAKTGGAFHFRGTAPATADGKPDVANPKPGDVYQVQLSSGRYNPETGDLIPSTVQYNDKEFSWAEKVDPNTGLPIGGQWVELGFNMDGNVGVTEQWVKEYFVGQWQEEEVLSGIIAHTQLSTTLETREQAVAEHAVLEHEISTIQENLSAYVDATAEALSAYVDTASASIMNYINNTVSTSIIYYVNEKVGELSTAISGLQDYVNVQDQILSTAIGDLSTYVDTQDQILSTAIGDLNLYVDNRMDVVSGGFLTRDEGDIIVNNIMNQHEKDLTFILYNDNGERIN